MSLLYYYIKNENYSLIDSGIDLIKHYDEKVILNNQIQPCIKCLLFPEDDKQKYDSSSYICVEIEMNIEDCYVVNDDLSILFDKGPYYESIIKLCDYRFGYYRNPRVILAKNINNSQIKKMDKTIGNPIIFNNSNDLYRDNIFEEFRSIYNDFDDTMLGVFFMLMTQKGKFDLLNKTVVEGNKTLYIYKDKKTEKTYTVCIKEGSKNG